jgi:hemoglobin-like flavoprotein
MTPSDIDLVQSSFAKVAPIADTAAGLFYGRLFEIAPEVRPLFKGDIAEQGRKLMATLSVVVNGLRNLDAIVPVAAQLAVRHVDYGVKPEHYPVVGSALLWTLEKGLGEAFTPDVAEAWTRAYGTLSGAMIAAAYPHSAAAS